MLLKFRHPNNLFGEFTHYADIPEEKIKRYVGVITPRDNVSFKFAIPIIEELRPYFNNRESNIYELRELNDFYFIDGGYIVFHNDGQLFFYHQNITHFRIGSNNPFVEINKLSYYFWCYFDIDRKLFYPIGGLNMQFAITSDEEISEKGLEKIVI